MWTFRLQHPRGINAAIALASRRHLYRRRQRPPAALKDSVETPDKLVDLERLPLSLHADATGPRLGSMARMSDGAASASPQVRSIGTMGGNLLQRTRRGYFRDSAFARS
jgi:hypothetical protein